MTAAYLSAPFGASVPTFQEAWKIFRAEHRAAVSPTTDSTDYKQTTNWVNRCPVTNLLEGRQALSWILSQDPPKAARRVVMFVRSMYRWAASEDVQLINRNPVANYRLPKAPQGEHEVRIIPRNEIGLVLVALEVKGHHRKVNWSLFADTQLQGAFRTGEVRAMRWNDIDGDRILVHQNYTLTHGLKNSTKTNKKRWVPLNNRIKETFASLPQDNDFIFPWNRSAYQSFFRQKMYQLFDAGLIKARYRPYDLRHVAISRWLEAGIPVATVAKIAGNTSEVIWRHYAGATQEYEIPVL